MSTTLSTSAMVTKVQKYIPINLDSAEVLFAVNKAFRWIDQNGPTVWRLTLASLAVAPGARVAPMPTDFDPSKPAWISGGPQWRLPIPFMPWDRFFALQTTGGSPMATQVGMFSAWSWVATGASGGPYGYTAHFYPESGAPSAGVNLPLVYHKLTPAPLASGSGIYFPTPDAYDDVIVDMATSLMGEQYSIAGWEMYQKRGEAALQRLAAGTRSSKEVVSELMEQAKQTQERQLARQE